MIQKWQNFIQDNKYFRFISQCRGKKYPKGIEIHVHHIIPRHMFGAGASPEELEYCESEQNLIRLSVADHVTAHALLYQIYKRPQDLGAVKMLQGDKEASRRIWRTLGAYAAHEILKETGKTFWNPKFQKEMGQRSMARPDALEIRSRGGKLGGTNRQKNRAIKPHERYEFCFKGEPVLCIINCDSGTQVIEELNKFQKTELSRASPLLNGTKKSLYGWSCKRLQDG